MNTARIDKEVRIKRSRWTEPVWTKSQNESSQDERNPERKNQEILEPEWTVLQKKSELKESWWTES